MIPNNKPEIQKSKVEKEYVNIERLKSLIARGVESRKELKYYLNLPEKNLSLLLKAIGVSVDENDFSVENIWAKFLVKQRVRYEQLRVVKEKAAKKNNLYMEIQCIKLMMEIDKDIVKVGQELGLIFKQPTSVEIKLPEEIRKYQEELKELEVEYFKLTGRKFDGQQDKRNCLQRVGEKDIVIEAENRRREEEKT